MEEEETSNKTVSNGFDFNTHHPSSDQLEPADAIEEDYIRCSRCDQQVVGQMYYSSSYPYYVHSTCIDLRKTLVNHPLHRHAALTLSIVEFDSNCHCYGCPKKFTSSFLGYKCIECPRKLDIKCALSDLSSSNLHCHALEFYCVNEQHQACSRKVRENEKVSVLIDDVSGKSCDGCQLPLIGPVRGCESCDFWIHKGCSENFQTKRTPSLSGHHHHLHRADHSLNFLSAPPFLNRCGACGRRVLRNTFHCEECSFDLHLGCASRKPSLRHELIGDIHHHDLTYFPDPASFFSCYACKGFSYKTPIYRCVECDFSLHKACIQFPYTLNHKSQNNCSLKLLKDFPVAEKKVCQVCDQVVSPNPGAYSCSDCQFFAHLECVSLEPNNQEKKTKVVGKVLPAEPLVDSTIEDRGKRKIDHRIDRLQKNIEANMAILNLEKKIVKERGRLEGLIAK